MKSATFPFPEQTLRSTQVFEQVGTDQDPVDPVGRPLIHQSAYKQATGEAIYVDDIPRTEGKISPMWILVLENGYKPQSTFYPQKETGPIRLID